MVELEKSIVKRQVVKLVYEEGIELSGIEGVISVDPKELIVKTPANTLTIKGEDINVEKLILETGELKAVGKIQSISYGSHHEKTSLLKKVFR